MQELQTIVQLVSQLGGDAKEAFIWWLVIDKALWYALVPVVVAVIGWFVLKVTSANNGYAMLRELRDAAGVGCCGSYTEYEHRQMLRWIETKRRQG